jgi:hypothetical protein
LEVYKEMNALIWNRNEPGKGIGAGLGLIINYNQSETATDTCRKIFGLGIIRKFLSSLSCLPEKKSSNLINKNPEKNK